MYKAICFVRVSTDAQEVESQKKVLLDYISNDGYSIDEILIIEGIGASAIKLNDLYNSMVARLKSSIAEHSTIKAVYINDLDRLGRNDEILIGLKNWFVDNKIQLVIKNLGIRLLNDDLSINQGAELSFSLMATLAKQEMAVKKERFKRGRDKNREQGKSIGGIKLFGLMTNDKGYIVVNEDEAEIIRLIFKLYIDGYSQQRLARELDERGIKSRDGRKFDASRICRITQREEYVKYGIITQETFNKARETAKSASITPHNYSVKRTYLCNKLITCPCCGKHLVCVKVSYYCASHFKKTDNCTFNQTIKTEIMDKIVWFVAKNEEISTRLDFENNQTLTDAQERLSVALSKIDVVKLSQEKIQSNRERILELYMSGDITREKKDEQLAKNNAKADALNTELETLQKDIANLEQLIDSIKNPNDELFDSITKGVVSDTDKVAIVRKNIQDIQFGEWHYIPKKVCEIKVVTRRNKEHIFRYYPQMRSGQSIEVLQNNGKFFPMFSI